MVVVFMLKLWLMVRFCLIVVCLVVWKVFVGYLMYLVVWVSCYCLSCLMVLNSFVLLLLLIWNVVLVVCCVFRCVLLMLLLVYLRWCILCLKIGVLVVIFVCCFVLLIVLIWFLLLVNVWVGMFGVSSKLMLCGIVMFFVMYVLSVNKLRMRCGLLLRLWLSLL